MRKCNFTVYGTIRFQSGLLIHQAPQVERGVLPAGRNTPPFAGVTRTSSHTHRHECHKRHDALRPNALFASPTPPSYRSLAIFRFRNNIRALIAPFHSLLILPRNSACNRRIVTGAYRSNRGVRIV